MRKLLLIRPEPGLAASVERAKALGLEVIGCPLFAIEPVEWSAPDADRFDALLLTSANAILHGGAALDALKALPVHTVGAATAEAARSSGFRVTTVGQSGVAALLAGLPQSIRLLHLAAEDHRDIAGGQRIDRRIVYRSAAIEAPGLPPLEDFVVAVHSPRSGARLAEQAESRGRTAIAAISAAAAMACGAGWERVEAAERPDDSSLLALASMLCHTSPPR